MVVGDGAAIRVRSQEVGWEEERRGEERIGWCFGYYWENGCAQQNMGANRISL